MGQLPLTPEETDLIRNLNVGISFASSILLMFIFTTQIAFKTKRITQGDKLVTLLSLVLLVLCLARSIPLFVSYDDLLRDSPVCTIQAVAQQFSLWMAVMIWVLVSVDLYQLLRGVTSAQQRLRLPPFRSQAAIMTLISSAVTALPLAYDQFGPQEFFCFLRSGVDWRWSVIAYGALIAFSTMGSWAMWLRVICLLRTVRARAQLYGRLSEPSRSDGSVQRPKPLSSFRRFILIQIWVTVVWTALICTLVFAWAIDWEGKLGHGYSAAIWGTNVSLISSIGFPLFFIFGMTRENARLWKRWCCSRNEPVTASGYQRVFGSTLDENFSREDSAA